MIFHFKWWGVCVTWQQLHQASKQDTVCFLVQTVFEPKSKSFPQPNQVVLVSKPYYADLISHCNDDNDGLWLTEMTSTVPITTEEQPVNTVGLVSGVNTKMMVTGCSFTSVSRYRLQPNSKWWKHSQISQYWTVGECVGLVFESVPHRQYSDPHAELDSSCWICCSSVGEKQ